MEAILTPAGLTDILENYAQIVEEKNHKTGKKKRKQFFPRFHQLDVVRSCWPMWRSTERASGT